MVAGAITSSVSGLRNTGNAISSIANNISNAETIGYKRKLTTFSSLVAGSVGGGVTSNERSFIDGQGLVQSTGRSTDLAISGSGFFAVQNEAGETFFTRAGSYTINNRGELVNEAGYTLLAWRLNNDGLRPGDPGNVDDTTPSESTDSLSIVDINTISGTAASTTTIDVGMNLNASQSVFQGATATIDLQDAVNNEKNQDQIIEPATGMQIGDQITFEANSVVTSFTYGGFSQSYNVGNGLFGVTSTTASFLTGTQADGSTLADGNQFTITPASGSAVTFTYEQTNPSFADGEFNSLFTLQQAIDATSEFNATLTDDGKLLVSSIDADDSLTFAGVNGSNLASELGFTNVASGSNRFNTLAGLAAGVNEQNDIAAIVRNPTASSTLEIFTVDPLQDLIVTKNSDTATISLLTPENFNKTETEMIIPTLGASSMTPGTSTLILTDAGSSADTFTYGGIGFTDAISTANTIFGADSTTATMTTGIGAADTITLDDGTGSVVLTFGTGVGQFDTLAEMATLINNDVGGNFNAEVKNGRLYVASTNDADAQITVATVDNSLSGLTTGTLATAFGGSFSVAGTAVAAAGGAVDRFNTLAQLDTLINASGFAVTSTLTTGAGASIALADGTTTGNDQLTIGGASNAQLLAALGLKAGDVGDDFFTELGLETTIGDAATSATINQSYDPASADYNMASGAVDAQFSRNIQIFDSLGTGHDFRLAYIKTGVNEWAVEFYSIDETEVITTNDDGLVASGTLTFNGDGSLRSITGSIASEFEISWTAAVGAIDNTVSIDLGTAGDIGTGLTDGVRQFNSSFNVEFAEQNGVSAGQFTSISINEEGFISANFTNGEVKQIYQIPIVLVANANLLREISGGVYATTQGSGDPNLKVVGNGGAGSIVPEALEGSNTDLAEELTRMIPTQTAYNASAKVITTADEMLETLNRI